MGSSPPGEDSQRHRLCAAQQVAMVLLLQGPRTTHFATGLCGFNANGAASAWLLLRTRQWCIYARSERCHCTASKELFDARYGDTYRPRTARIAHALTRHGGRSSATPNEALQIPPACSCSQEFAPPFAVPFRSLLFPRIGPNLTARRSCHYALCVKDLAKRCK